MAGLKQIQEQQEKWAAEGKDGGGAFNALYPKRDDLVFYHFLSTGEDNDPFFEVYFSHELPPAKEGQFSTLKYCPVESGHDTAFNCKYCAAGLKTKKRMAMWLHVGDWLHAAPVQGMNLPTAVYNNRTYYVQQLNEPRIWETSAWRESCLTDIIFQGASMGNLHNAQFQLVTTGDGRDRRYKVVALFNSQPFSRELYAADKPKCQPIIDWLKEGISEVATASAPEGAAAYQPQAQPQPQPQAAQPEPTAPSAPTQPTMMQEPAQPQPAAPAQAYQPGAQQAPAQQYTPPQAAEVPAQPANEPWETGDKVNAADGPLPDLAQPAPPPKAGALF